MYLSVPVAATLATNFGEINMNNVLFLILMFITGLLLGAIYLASLWWNVKRITGNSPSVLWATGSLMIRLVLVGATFYIILSFGNWQHLVATLAGFITIRAMTLRHIRRSLPKAEHQEQTT